MASRHKSHIDSMIPFSINHYITNLGMSAMVARCRSRALSSFPCKFDDLS